MKKRIICLILPIITLILEILPYGAVLNFMLPSAMEGLPAGRFRELYSYFDLMPFGYANFAPLLTAVTTCLILTLLLIYLITGKARIITVAEGFLCIGVVLSLCPLLYGIDFFSVVGALITISLIAELLLIQFIIKGKPNK